MRNRLLSAILIAILSIGSINSSNAQTTLAPGDLSFVGFNSALSFRDGFAFVLWIPVTASTTIKFTDNGFNSSSVSTAAGNVRELEQTITWQASNAIAAGTVIRIEGDGISATTTSTGTITAQNAGGTSTSFMGLLNGGDNFFAFQGNYSTANNTAGTMSGTALFLVGYQGIGATTAFLSSGTTGTSTSYVPSDLSSYNMFFTGNAVAAEYTGARTGLTIAQFKAAVNNTANWTTYTNPNGVNVYNTTNFSTATAPSISVHPSNRTICAANNTTMSITATGATSYQWQVNTGSGFTNISNVAPYSGATTATLTFTSVTAGMSGYTYRCVATNATGSTNSSSATLTVSNPAASTWQTNVACNGGSTGNANVIALGGITPYSYSWSPAGGTAATANSLSAGAYSCTITDNIGCTVVKNFTISQATAITSSVTTNNAACTAISNGSATVSVSGGEPSYSYSWSPSGGSSATASNLAAGNYSVLITDANACTKSQSVTIGTNSGTQTGALAGVAGSGATTQTQSVTTASGNYTDGSCNRITTIQPSGASPVSGNVTTKVWVESAVPAHAGLPYVARHYEITPAVNASTATGTVTLYFLQSEFDAFNAATGSTLKLPTSAADAAGIANLRIGKYSGTSSDNSGLPASYSGGTLVLNPGDASIVWNATAERWEISFDVAGFSGFIVQTSSFTLPVSLVSFHAERSNEKVSLTWQTASENNSSHFIIEHSIDGRSFSGIGTVTAAGNSSSLLNYSFIHDRPLKEINYYRLRQVDIDGRAYNSNIRMVSPVSKAGGFTIMVNPVQDGRLQVQFNKAANAVIYNNSGRVMLKLPIAAGTQTVDISGLPGGLYVLQAGNEAKKFIVE